MAPEMLSNGKLPVCQALALGQLEIDKMPSQECSNFIIWIFFILGMMHLTYVTKFHDQIVECLIMQLSLLNVSNNKLKTLPESIGSCFSLEELQANGMFKSLFFLHF